VASTGGTAPNPERYGGGLRVFMAILEGLNAARGTAYDVTHDSNVYAENMAHARALGALWSTNQRLANQVDPARTTSMLARWERIFCLAPLGSDRRPARRRVLASRWRRVGVSPTTQSIVDELSAAIGPILVAYYHETIASALTYWPGGTPSVVAPWFSDIARAVVQVQAPPGMTDGEFYAGTQAIAPILDARLPAWMTWVWWRVDSRTGLKGFYCDAPHNLDNSAFDV
jgi:hypothetical protein